MSDEYIKVAFKLYPIINQDGWDYNKQYRDEWLNGVIWARQNLYTEDEITYLSQVIPLLLKSIKNGDKEKINFYE